MQAQTDDVPVDSLSQTVAQSIASLLRVRLVDQARPEGMPRGSTVASSFELAQLVGDFMRIHDPGERRICLALIRSRSAANDR